MNRKPIKSIIRCDDFFNKAAKHIDSVYFPHVTYYMDCKETTKIHRILELFNNGAIAFTGMVTRIAQICNVSNAEIHLLLENYVEITY